MAVGSSQSSNIYPPQSPTRITNNSILKLSGAFHCVKTSSMRFCAFSYSIGEPCERSDQLSIYFIGILPVELKSSERLSTSLRASVSFTSPLGFLCIESGQRSPPLMPHTRQDAFGEKIVETD